MKKLLLILVLSLFLPTAFAATSATASDASGSKGSTVKVPVNVAGASKIGSMDMVLEYDPAVLKAVGVEKGALTANALFESDIATPGRVVIVLADSAGFGGEGSIATVNFEVIGEAGRSSAITLAMVDATGAETLLDVQLSKRDGTFTVSAAAPAAPAGKGICGPAVLLLIATMPTAMRRLRK